MRTRPILLLSLGLNLALALGWLFATRPTVVQRLAPGRRALLTTNVIRPIRTNVVVVPELFSWQQVETADYPTYIRNLRGIGCPEPTIRDIIVAEVNQLFAKRRATELVTVSQQWWRSDPDPEVRQAASDKANALDRERRRLLTQLLGPGWEDAAETFTLAGTTIAFDGPVLSELSLETRRAVRDAESQAQERLQSYLKARAKDGKPPDEAELAKLRLQSRAELAKLLSPAQLEEYLLRYSQTASQLREGLRGFDASMEEFRGLFRAADGLGAELASLASATSPADLKRRQELQQQLDEATKAALKPERFQYFKLNADPVFQQARQTAQDIGATPENVLPLYQINQATQEERRRVLGDNSLTSEEQAEKLSAIHQQQLDALLKLLGEKAFRKLQEASTK